MTTIIIIISIMLNIIALMAIVILFLRQNKLLKFEVDQRKSMTETEGLMSSYLLEMKDENERFIERVKRINEEKSELEDSSVQVVQNQKEQELLVEKKDNQGDFSSHLGKAVSFQAVKAYQKHKKEQVERNISNETKVKATEKVEEPPPKSEQKDVHNTNGVIQESLSDQIMNMKQQGLSEEEIAKKLNKGKTEIALLLKFRENQ
ncbi:hypothetical protein JMM81_03880 [Bacillus sp. V3B]|uniref:DUF6115 domain-containing protein n=1 Tax=Bacillus sp. V3B TaxID=2804915 RepID=UPI00210D7CAF|nr:hypothetical protein [Bacillus sp. V3B]MCQ6274121.1 hypothetical protein [Bacillus sp. V3B]